MKKLFFSLAFMLIGTFAFANNSNQTVLSENLKEYDSYAIESTKFSENSVGTCYVLVGYYDEDGNRVGGALYIISDIDSQEQCEAAADKLIDLLNS